MHAYVCADTLPPVLVISLLSLLLVSVFCARTGPVTMRLASLLPETAVGRRAMLAKLLCRLALKCNWVMPVIMLKMTKL